MSMATVWERILLHLRGYNSYRDQRGVPEQISQAGIAEALGIGVGHVSKVIKRLHEDGKDWIDEDFKHVKGSKRKRKVYFLTNEGREKEEEIRDRLKKEDIDLLTKKGSRKIKLSEMEDHLNKRDPISFAVNNLREENVLDLRDKNRGKDIFVGRREEMSKLKQLLKKVGEGDGRSIFIKGVAGIGKTRLILEFRKHVSEEGFEFLYGNSYSSSSDAYLPVKEAIQRYLKRNKDFDKSLEDIPLFEQYKDIDIDETEIYKAQRQSTFYRTKELLRDISFRDPLVIFLDDLQWADKATLDLLYYMLSKLDDGKVLFIGAYRPEDIDTNHPLQEMIRKAIRKDIFEEIELGPIDKPNGRKIIENTIGRDQLPDEFLESVHEKANGNPLFLQEIAKQAFEKYGDEIHQFEKSYVENMKMPDIIEQLVSRRIDKLDEKQRRILQVGTIIGKEVPFDLLNEMLAMDEIELLENVDEIMKANLWHEHPEDDVFHVSNPLILDTIYNDMGELRKKTLHKKLAKTIEDLRKDELEEYYSYLANQYLKGGEKEEAFDYYLKSGGYDESVFAHENAVEKYKKALDLAEELDKDRSDILMKMGEANKHMGKFEDSRDNYQEAIVDMEDTEKQQHVYKKIGETYVIQGDYDKALNHIEQGLSLSDKANSARLELLHMKGWTMVKVGRYDDAEEIFNRAQDLAEEFGNEAYIAKIKNDLGAMSVYKGEYSKAIDRLEDAIDIRKRRDEITELGKIYNNLGLVYRKKGQLSRALDYLDQSLEIREERNDRYHMATTLTNMGLVYTNQGKLDQALETHEESLEIWTEIGSTDGRAGAINNIGDVYRKKGLLDKALNKYLKCLDLWKETDNKYGISITVNNLGMIYNAKGKFDKSEDYLKRSLELSQEIGDKYSEGLTDKNLGKLYRNMGELDRSIQHLRNAIDISKEVGSDKLNISSKCELVNDYLEQDKVNSAYLLTEEMLEKFDEMDDPVTLIKLYRTIGMVERERGEFNRSRKFFTKAYEKSGEIDNLESKAMTLYEEGKLLIEMGKDASNNIKRARDVFEKGGFDYWRSKSEELLKEIS